MAAAAITAFLNSEHVPPEGVIFTAVLPGGCQLSCPFCFVRQRSEGDTGSGLTPEHLTAAIRAFGEGGDLAGVAVVGDEPLQSHVWKYTRAMLDSAVTYDVHSACITNGLGLQSFSSQLNAYRKLKLLLSLDAVGTEHDKIRGQKGVFSSVCDGIPKIAKRGDYGARLSIATVMFPKKRERVFDVIEFAGSQRVDEVLLSPLLKTSSDQALNVFPYDIQFIANALPKLFQVAERAKVRLRISDEFGVLAQWEDRLRASGVDVCAPKHRPNLVRIDANGRIETLETLKFGGSTGLSLPANVSDVAETMSKVRSLLGGRAMLAA